jgi:arylsulfatase A-like enzyme
MAAYSAIVGQAKSLIYNDPVSRVFQFSTADESRYGNTNFGRAMIVARNAVQSKLGTVFMSITREGWDQHFSQFDSWNQSNLYRLNNDIDTGIGNLIADLRISGDLDSTLIVAMGEFGRTPGPLNYRNGRDHYASVMSVLMAGGGVRGGQAIGTTDATGAFIVDTGWSRSRPIYVEDITCTIYSALGIDWTKQIENNPMGRTYIYVPGSAAGDFGPIEEVFR